MKGGAGAAVGNADFNKLGLCAGIVAVVSAAVERKDTLIAHSGSLNVATLLCPGLAIGTCLDSEALDALS